MLSRCSSRTDSWAAVKLNSCCRHVLHASQSGLESGPEHLTRSVRYGPSSLHAKLHAKLRTVCLIDLKNHKIQNDAMKNLPGMAEIPEHKCIRYSVLLLLLLLLCCCCCCHLCHKQIKYFFHILRTTASTAKAA